MEDNGSLRRLLMDVIASEPDLSPDGAGSIAEAEALIADPDSDYAAILLDLTLPDGDGRSFCRSLRNRGLMVPILVLSGETGENSTATVLDSGATLYLAKPIRIGELLQQLRAQLPKQAMGSGACSAVAEMSAASPPRSSH